jgi:uncharacterized membrane protein YvlD (DUF360 family)
MKAILVTWAAITLGMFVSTKVLPRMKLKGGLGSHLVVSGAFGVILAFTGWFFHLLLGISTFGLLFIFGSVAQVLVAAIVLKITDAFFGRLKVDGFGTAILAGLIISIAEGLARYAMFHFHV